MIRFLHASDLHVGKPFGGFPEEVRHTLRQARNESIGSLSAAARNGGATHVLLAGDTFDAETPQRSTLRQAMNAMAGQDDLTWVLMPGNHDHLGADEIWSALRRERPANVLLALTPEPIPLVDGIVLLPAPCTTKSPGRDLTEWMNDAETGDAVRIGLAHGSIRDFRSVDEMGGEGSAVIAPDRAQRAGLDYLGFGDWHGRIEVTPNTWYSGTPEADSFKPHRSAGALLVSISAAGAPAKVTEVETGKIRWTRVALELLEGDEVAIRLTEELPPLAARNRVLMDFRATGRVGLSTNAALAKAIDDVAPDFLWIESNLSALVVAHDSDDLSLIDDRGAVRDAAEALAEAAEAGDAVAARALSRLFSYALEAK